MLEPVKRLCQSVCGFSLLVWSMPSSAEYGVNFPPPATPNARNIYDLHMLTMGISTVILLIVFGVVCYSVFFHRKSRGAQADQNFHNGWFGHWAWVLVPAIVLGVDLTIAGSAQAILKNIWVVPKDQKMMDIKVTGHQWYWEYEYIDDDLRFESRFVPEDKAGELFLRATDRSLVLPTNTRIRFLHTSADVLHAFWVPELGFKKDSIPGYITETWAYIEREGTFRGQCAELCGTWHARMPIVVEAVSPERFAAWVKDEKATAAAAAAEAAATDKTWELAELVERGRNLYNAKCAPCHQLNGEGLQPAFPALKGSAMVAGPPADHLSLVLNGKTGTAMQAWGGLLNNLQVAAIITYERNAWGNDTGDIVQPADVLAARGADAANQNAAAKP